MGAPDKIGYLNGHPIVNGVSVGLLHKAENGQDVGVDVLLKGKPGKCVMVHRSSVMLGTGTGLAARHDVLLPDMEYPVYEWASDRIHAKPTGKVLSCEDVAGAIADADAQYRKSKGRVVALSSVGKNMSPVARRLAESRENTITDAYLAGSGPGDRGDEDGLDL